MAIKTFAAIDVGSFELSMKIFEVTPYKGMREIDHVRRSIDMGTETYTVGKLSYARVDELCRTLKEFKKIMDSYQVDEYKAYGTSAIRESKNTTILLDQILQRTGIKVDVLSNSEQRFLDYKSIAFQGERFDKFIGKGTAIMDIGGASIQMSTFEKDRLVSTQNMRLGVLRIKDRMNTIGASLNQYEKLVTELCEAQINTYKRLYLKDDSIQNLIIVDDHISMLVNRGGNRIKGNEFDIKAVKRALEEIKVTPKAEVSKMFGVSEEEIPLLYISLIVLHLVMSTIGAVHLWAPGVILCDGIAYEYAEKNNIITSNHNFEDDIRACAIQLSKKYDGSKKRSETIEMIALEIFDAVSKEHGLTPRDRLLLQISAYLHDCGKYVSLANLAECSYNIIKNTEIIGISHKERIILANTVKFNQLPFEYYDDFSDSDQLDRTDHMQLAKLTAILRLANGLDRSHRMKCRNIKAEVSENKLMLYVETDEDITLEKGLFKNRAMFFEEIYNLEPVIKQRRSF